MVDPRISRHANAHHGVFAQEFLDSVGIHCDQARRYVLAGHWRRLHEGVFAGATTPDSFELRAEAALLALPAAVLGLRAAAIVHGCEVSNPVLDVCTAHGTRNRLAGVRIHQTALPDHHVVRRHGWRVTTLERTLVDLGKVVPASELQRCIEDSVITRRTTMARVEHMFAELAVRGRPGIARTRGVLSRLDPEPPTESELEAMFWRMLERNTLPLPQRQASFDWLGSGAGRVDFWYPDQRLVIELDGRRFHLRAAAFEADRKRDQLGLLEGITSVRFTPRQVTTEAPHVLRVMRGLVA